MEDRNPTNSSKVKNPYTFGVPVKGVSNFFGRSSELNLISDTLENVPRGQKQDIVIIGPRRIGKSSLLYRLAEILKPQKNFIPVYIDLQNIKPREINTLFYKFATEIRKGYEQKGFSLPQFKILNSNIVEDLQFMIFSDDMTDVDSWITETGAPNLVLLIDEVELLIDFGGLDTLDWLRSLIQRLSHCVFIVAGSESLYTLTQDYGSPFYNIFKTIEIHPLTDAAAKELIMKPAVDVGIIIHANEVKKILEHTGNVPYFIQGVAHYIVQELNEQRRRSVTDSDVEKVIRESSDYFSAQFSYYWGQLTQVQRALLFLLARNKSPLSTDQLVQKLPDSDMFFDLLRSKQARLDTFDNLLQLQILRRTEQEYLWFVVPLFAGWILNKVSDKEVFDILGKKIEIDFSDVKELQSVVLESFYGVSELRSFIHEYFPSISANIDFHSSMRTLVLNFIDSLNRRGQLNELKDALRTYNSQQYERVSSKSYTDIVIVTNLEVELDAVLKKFPDHQRSVQSDWEEGLVYTTNLSINEQKSKRDSYRIVITRLSKIGSVQAALTTSKIIRFWQPRYIIRLGLADGNDNEGVGLGDILVSNSFVDLQLRDMGSKELSFSPNVIAADRRLVNYAREFRDSDWAKLIKVKRPMPGRPKCHFGPIASSEKIIKHDFETTKTWDLSLIGIEMEAAGMAQAVVEAQRNKNNLGTGFLSVLGVSQLIFIGKQFKDLHWDTYAADAAASFLVGLLRMGPFSPRDS